MWLTGVYLALALAGCSPFPAPIYLQPLSCGCGNTYVQDYRCRPYWSPWTPMSSHVLVPIMPQPAQQVPRTYFLKLLRTNPTIYANTSTTTGPLPSCPCPDITSSTSLPPAANTTPETATNRPDVADSQENIIPVDEASSKPASTSDSSPSSSVAGVESSSGASSSNEQTATSEPIPTTDGQLTASQLVQESLEISKNLI